VHSCGQLEYLGTNHHPSPAWLNFPENSGGEAVQRHVSPGYVFYQEQDGDEGSTDSEGYHDSPAVFVVSANCKRLQLAHRSCNRPATACHNLPKI
jgi:ribosomal protein L32